MKLEPDDIDLECLDCKKVFIKKAKELKKGSQHKCPGCGAEMVVKDDAFTKYAKALNDILK